MGASTWKIGIRSKSQFRYIYFEECWNGNCGYLFMINWYILRKCGSLSMIIWYIL
jgi:hypothetical protein